MSDAVKYIVRNEYEDNPGIRPGDIFCNNDPHIGDLHNADVQNILPIFWQDELVGWATGVTHEIDVGSPQPAAMPVGTTSRFEDGWILSCQRVGTNDELSRDHERRIQSAVRTPFYWLLDEKCRISACQLARDTVLRLIEEEGLDVYKQFVREVIEDTRRTFKRRVQDMLIPGTYRYPSFMDVPHAADKDVMPDFAAVDSLMHCPLKLTVDENASFDMDLDGASKWGHHSFNCTMSSLQGGLWVSLTQNLVPNEKVNDGAYLATTLNNPYGSWANPDNPNVSHASSQAYLIPCFTGLIHSLSRGFAARGLLEEVIAAFPYTGNMLQGGGTNQYGLDGAWSSFEFSSCGISARWAWDGETACAAMWNPEGDMGDVEAWETLEPNLYLGRGIRPNTAGLGKRRGGSGFESIRLLYGTDSQIIYHGREGHVFCTTGLFGGYPGATGYRHSIKNTDIPERIKDRLPYPVSDGDSEDSAMSANVNGEHLRDRRMYHFPDPHGEYDVILNVLAGGHGLGDVLEREPDSVADDINGNYILPRFADTHGVVATADEDGVWRADSAETEQRRKELREQRLERSVPVGDWIAGQKARVERQDFIDPVRKMYRESADLSGAWLDDYRRFWGLSGDWTP